jgi:hypothetical protein
MTLFSCLTAAVTLAGWLIYQLRAFYMFSRSWWFHRRISGRIAALKPPDKTDQRTGILLLRGAGILVGAIAAYELSQVLGMRIKQKSG